MDESTKLDELVDRVRTVDFEVPPLLAITRRRRGGRRAIGAATVVLVAGLVAGVLTLNARSSDRVPARPEPEPATIGLSAAGHVWPSAPERFQSAMDVSSSFAALVLHWNRYGGQPDTPLAAGPTWMTLSSGLWVVRVLAIPTSGGWGLVQIGGGLDKRLSDGGMTELIPTDEPNGTTGVRWWVLSSDGREHTGEARFSASKKPDKAAPPIEVDVPATEVVTALVVFESSEGSIGAAGTMYSFGTDPPSTAAAASACAQFPPFTLSSDIAGFIPKWRYGSGGQAFVSDDGQVVLPTDGPTGSYFLFGGLGTYLDVRRGGLGAQGLADPQPVAVLGVVGQTAPIEDGFGVQFRLGNDPCDVYAVEGHGMNQSDFLKIVAAFERTHP